MRQDDIECLVSAGMDCDVARRFYTFLSSRTDDAGEVEEIIATIFRLLESGYVLCEIEPGKA